MRTRVLFSMLVLSLALQSAPGSRPEPVRSEIAPGVYLYQTAPYGGAGLDGNAIAIVGSESVLVFDTNGTPSAAGLVLADLKKLTKLPVRYVVNSHWHWDHWYGTEVYRDAFPRVEIIAHRKTRQLMAGPAIDFNRPGLETQLPEYIASLEAGVARARSTTPPSARLPQLEQELAAATFFLAQKKAARHVLPTRTFTDRLVLDLGRREVHVLHHDRAVTPGDAFLYLPAEKILVTGDLLVNPVSFALSSYPTTWLKTLEYLDGLDATIIVPGHGAPLRDESLLHATMDAMRIMLREGKAARARGTDVDTAREQMMPQLADVMKRIAGDDPARQEQFKIYLVDWYLHRVYEELEGPLSDAIARIPAR